MVGVCIDFLSALQKKKSWTPAKENVRDFSLLREVVTGNQTSEMEDKTYLTVSN